MRAWGGDLTVTTGLPKLNSREVATHSDISCVGVNKEHRLKAGIQKPKTIVWMRETEKQREEKISVFLCIGGNRCMGKSIKRGNSYIPIFFFTFRIS